MVLNVPAPTDIYTLSLHDALPIYRSPFELLLARARQAARGALPGRADGRGDRRRPRRRSPDRKSTRLNSSHLGISYAVFCLKKKTNEKAKASPSWPSAPAGWERSV